MAIRAILFDLDDTLYERRVVFRAWADALLHEHSNTLSPAEASEAVSRLTALDANGYGNRSAFVAELIQLFPRIGTSTDAVLERFRLGFLQHLVLSPETRNVLVTLKTNAIPFGIITNGSTIPQGRKIKQLELESFTDCVFISESFGVKKPDSRIFHAAANCLKTAPGSILFVGDHAENDIVGAKQAGMQAAWLSRGNIWNSSAHKPDFVLSHLTEVTDLLGIPSGI